MKLMETADQMALRDFLGKITMNIFGEDKVEANKWLEYLRPKRTRRSKDGASTAVPRIELKL